MAIDTTPGTPGWWLSRLLDRMNSERPRLERLDRYYRGSNGIPVLAPEAVRESYERLMAISRTNFAALVVQAPLERMQPVGFRTGAADDRNGDAEAWRIWQANHLDAGCWLVHEACLSMSMGYVIVGPVDADSGVPLITPEDPREVTVETDPGNRRRVRAALKVVHDSAAGEDTAWLHLPGQVWRAKASTNRLLDDTSTSLESPSMGSWEWDAAWPMPAGYMAVVPFPANPTMTGVGVGEFEPHLSILDRINYQVLQRLEIATLQAFRQRALKGGPTVDENGNEINYDDIFSASPGAIWHLPETAELWESGQVDLRGVLEAARDDVKILAAVTGTPLFYLTPEATDGSAEGASLARERLLFKTRRHITEATEAWEQVMSNAFRMAGDAERANRVAMEVVWAPPEHWSLNQKADAATKAIAGGLTWRKTMEVVWGMSPQEIDQMEQDRAAEALMAQGAQLVEQVMNGAGSPAGQPAAG